MIIATGPWTLVLLESSRIQLPYDFRDSFFSITTISIMTLSFNEDKYERFKLILILVIEQDIFKLLI